MIIIPLSTLLVWGLDTYITFRHAPCRIFPYFFRFAELMELFGAASDVDKINAYVKRKGPGHYIYNLSFNLIVYYTGVRQNIVFPKYGYALYLSQFEILNNVLINYSYKKSKFN